MRSGVAPGGIAAAPALKRSLWRDRDLKRAIRIAEKSGLAFFRIEIGPDGTISIVVGDGPRRPTARKPRFLRKPRKLADN